MNFNRNNLNKSLSPYLQHHKDSPINWQEWSSEVVQYAAQQDKLILISLGYSSCHWCHIMAHDTFQDSDTANFLNEQYVSILIDREMRPDIDQYMISFAMLSNGSAGWPLNVVLTPDLKPFASATYVSSKTNDPKTPTFLFLLQKAFEHYQQHKDDIKHFIMPITPLVDALPQDIIVGIESEFDQAFGGFGDAPKFPPHSTLSFLITVFGQQNVKTIYIMLKKTLDAMSLGGLHDHLQGGFFRYCTDRQWAIPHFEKMLYDQAWLLWNYSAAYKALKEDNYKKVADKLTQFLLTSFTHDTFFFSSIDADTDHEEGAFYLWTADEIKTALTSEEYKEFSRLYKLNDAGNIASSKKNLIKNHAGSLDSIEQKLLKLRQQKPKPFVDTKCLTSWNAIAGVSLIMAYRCTLNIQALEHAQKLFDKLCALHINKDAVFHCSIDGAAQTEGFLEDYASMLLFATYMHEETGNYKDLMLMLYKKILEFKKESFWFESLATDFQAVPANPYDFMLPTSSSIAEVAVMRTRILNHEEIPPVQFKTPLKCDFLNISTLISNGIFHIIDSPTKIEWQHLPLNTIQRRGSQIKHHLAGVTIDYPTIDALLNALSTNH